MQKLARKELVNHIIMGFVIILVVSGNTWLLGPKQLLPHLSANIPNMQATSLQVFYIRGCGSYFSLVWLIISLEHEWGAREIRESKEHRYNI